LAFNPAEPIQQFGLVVALQMDLVSRADWLAALSYVYPMAV
jgi:hypothetical protein